MLDIKLKTAVEERDIGIPEEIEEHPIISESDYFIVLSFFDHLQVLLFFIIGQVDTKLVHNGTNLLVLLCFFFSQLGVFHSQKIG